MEDPQAIYESLRTSGHRLTEARKALVDFFCAHKRPVSADTALKKVASRKGVRVHKVTIYRELDFLVESGVLQQIHFGDRKTRYELARRPHHHHIVCNKCKRIEDVFLHQHLEREMQRIQKQTKFKITSHALEFFGLCRQCLTQT